jgi:peptidoglycan/xylan/chitin deacetylase (PgdA/CDA1 family)
VARLTGPDESCRVVYLVSGANKGKAAAQGMSAPIYVDQALTTLADIRSTTDEVIAESTVTVDAYSRIPLFKYPDGVDTVYTSINGGPSVALYARTDDRLDALASAGAATQTTAAGAAQKSANLSDLTAPATARTNLGLGGAAQLSVGTAAGTVAAGNDSRIVGALQRTGDTLTGQLYAANGTRLPLVQPSYRRPRWRDATYFRENFQAGHGWVANGTGVASSNLNDTTAFVRGTQSVSITSVGTVGQPAGIRKTSIAGLSTMNLADKMFRLVIRVESGATHLSNLNFFIGTSGFANYYKFVVNPVTSTDQYASQGDWVVLTFGWNDLNSSSGSYTATNGIPNSLTGFTDMQIQVADDGSPVQLRIQALEIVDGTTTTFPKGVVSITFDDSWASQWSNARPVMDTYGYRGTMYTIVQNVGSSGTYVTLSQLKQLQNQSGWGIAGHAYTSATHSTRLPNLTAAQVDQDTADLKIWLLQNGFDGDSYAYPGGEMRTTTDGASVEEIVSRYFSSARSIFGQASRSIETFPPSMPWRMRSCSSISSLNAANGWTNPTGIVGAGGVLDRIAANGGWWIATFHEITSGAPANTAQCSLADFTSILSGISSRGIACLPVSDVMRHFA